MSCNNPNGQCPSAGYPTPACSCGCSGGDPGPVPVPPYYPPSTGQVPGAVPVPLTRGDDGSDIIRAIADAAGRAAGALGFDGMALSNAVNGAGKACSGWKVDPGNATTEYNICCTPSVGRTGGRFKVAACLKMSRPLDPWAGRRPGTPNGTAVG